MRRISVAIKCNVIQLNRTDSLIAHVMDRMFERNDITGSKIQLHKISHMCVYFVVVVFLNIFFK